VSIEQQVAQHYARGSLEQAILDALVRAGKDPAHLVADDLAPVDEFHTGGRQATVEFTTQLGLTPGMRLIDIGSGIGGPARYVAQQYRCHVTGVDLTEDYVRIATSLSRHVGLDGAAEFVQASALALPFAPEAFDGAYMLHVGMNIADKAKLFAEVRRVLKPGAVFGVYDIMRQGDGEIAYPVPWAATPETSFVADPASYRRLLREAGFEVAGERERRQFAIDFFSKIRARVAESGLPPLGLHIVIAEDFQRKMANMVANIEAGRIAPVEIIGRAA
jgi:ubiquinone/menaquinone biosynthesis C-methylase UbiE